MVRSPEPESPANVTILRTTTRPRFALPIARTALLGREQDLTVIRGLLSQGATGLLTLTGAGGSGKTRLALAAAEAGQEAFADGVVFVSLASVTEPDLVIAAVAQGLDVREAAGRTLVEQLIDELQGRQLLLVLDNFEQVLPARTLVAELLRRCADLTILVTSRAALHLSDEQEFPVQPLALPRRDGALEIGDALRNPAIALFCQRAQAVRPDFQLTADNLSAVVEICYRLDGLPLALELAAARCKLFAPGALLPRLEHRLAMLTGGPLDRPARLQTLRAAIAWSHDLLDSAERALFRRLAVFPAGCTLEAVARVAALDDAVPWDVLATVTALVDKSLLTRQEGRDGEPRFTMLETIREFALEQLVATGELDEAQRCCVAFILSLIAEASPDTRDHIEERWLVLLDEELATIRAVLARVLGERTDAEAGLALAAGLHIYWIQRGLLIEGRRWIERALLIGANAKTATRAPALAAAGRMSWFLGDYTRAQVLHTEAVTLFRELGDTVGAAYTLSQLGIAFSSTGDLSKGRAFCEEAVQLWRGLDKVPGPSYVFNQLAAVATFQGDLATAQRASEEQLALSRTWADEPGIATALRQLGRLAAGRDDKAAQELLTESLEMMRAQGDRVQVAQCLSDLGILATVQGNQAEAALRLGEALTLGRELGIKASEGRSLLLLGDAARLAHDPVLATTRYAESLKLYRDQGDARWLRGAVRGMAGTAVERGQAERAARLLGFAESRAGRETIPAGLFGQWASVLRALCEQDVAAVRAALGEKRFTAAFEAGRALSLDQAIAEALSESPDAPAPAPRSVRSAYPDGLSAREVEVLRLAAAGKSNPEIAATLVLSRNTVQRHMNHIFTKTGTNNRVEAATYAQRHHLTPE